MNTVDDLLDRRILFVTGKGGIGKSFVSANLGLTAALRGKRVCIVENRVDDQIATLFGKPMHSHQLTEIQKNLFAINLDSQENFRDFVVKHLGFESLFERVFNTKIIKSFIRLLPGIAELTLLGRLYHMAALSKPAFDLVILDGYSSGHFLNLMTTPDAILKSGLIGPVQNETKKLRAFINQPKNSAMVLVTTAESLVMSEALEFVPQLININLSELKAIFVNRYFDDTEVSPVLAKIAERGPKNKLALAADFCSKKYQGFREQVLQLKTIVSKISKDAIPIVAIPDFGAVPEPYDEKSAQAFLSNLRPL